MTQTLWQSLHCECPNSLFCSQATPRTRNQAHQRVHGWCVSACFPGACMRFPAVMTSFNEQLMPNYRPAGVLSPVQGCSMQVCLLEYVISFDQLRESVYQTCNFFTTLESMPFCPLVVTIFYLLESMNFLLPKQYMLNQQELPDSCNKRFIKK